MGDINAKILSNNSGREQTTGKEGFGDIMNENGELFCDFCAFSGLAIGRSVSPHKSIHKVTWVSPDNHTENQIDHICISGNLEGH
jgi:hypothetical protein